MVRNIIFYTTCSGFMLGVLMRSFLRINLHAAFWAAGIALCLITGISAITFITKPQESNHLHLMDWKIRTWILMLCIFIFTFSLGIIRFHIADKVPPEFFQNQIGNKIAVAGLIVEEPVAKENDTMLTVEAYAHGAKTKMILSAKNGIAYRYGDELAFEGKLQKPENFLTDQDKEFDYVNYLRKDSIFYAMYHPTIEVRSRGHGDFLKRTLFSFKEKFTVALESAIKPPESSLLKGLMLGERASFSQSLRQSFINTGTIHIVTIAGYHVALVASWIMKLLAFLPLALAASADVIAIFLYVLVTGASQTAIRAGIMATLALTARVSGRLYDATRALVLAAVLMVLINPLILAFDVSFQLSFLATIAVILLAPRIEKYFLWIPWKRFRDIVAITCAMYIFVLPFILYKIGNLSLVALPANLALVPFIAPTMIVGFLTGFAGLVSGIAAWVPGTIAYALLHYELAAIGFFSQLSFASLTVPNFPFALVLLVYAIFFWYLFVSPSPKLKPAQVQAEWENNSSSLGFGKTIHKTKTWHVVILIAGFLLTLTAAGLLYWRHATSNQIAHRNLKILLANPSPKEPLHPFELPLKTKSSGCAVHDHLPDQDCTPGAVFSDASVEQICVKGYTKTVRNVSTQLRQEVYAAYSIPYPQERGAYEVDHLIPLALGGSNDSANLWTETAEPIPGFHEKDLVEVYLQQEVCSGRIALPAAQRQIANDWIAVYQNLTPEELLTLKKKYGGR